MVTVHYMHVLCIMCICLINNYFKETYLLFYFETSKLNHRAFNAVFGNGFIPQTPLFINNSTQSVFIANLFGLTLLNMVKAIYFIQYIHLSNYIVT